ncbi:histidinol dehydrogenase [Priestia taiwanensis]|uniref:Uncharacterized protein n=1 Tax=Priestia taiwanensis TaxID=1347902 RepID=A0A917AUQ0_9BACI|nr:histidinol dehydrogenase [Priestia taiwanensis]MBM7364061.1 hypothetical protein [Priestia taiwanensis]GGE71297.1 hypothetical protein GCM10007140_21510 [Priestia taiwanensis]
MFRYFKFRLNDKVKFKEADGHIYRIVGYRLERSFYPSEDWTTIVYELYRDFDGLAVDAEEDDLVLMSKRDEGIVPSIMILKTLRDSLFSSEEKGQAKPCYDVDILLDEYNDYKRLSEFFEDTTYEQKMHIVMEKLAKYTEVMKEPM